MKDKISVVIPLYNKARHVRRAIDSVLAQSYGNLELIVVDDGSTDGGTDIVRRYDDPRLQLVVQENAGVSAARNRGVMAAASELVAFLDADDEWQPQFLQTVLDLRAKYPDAGIYATGALLSRDGQSWTPEYAGAPDAREGGLLPDYFRAAMGMPPVCSSAVMIPKAVLAEVGGFPVGVARGEDMSTWASIALRYRVAWAPLPGAVYHLSAGSRVCDCGVDQPDVGCANAIEAFLQSGVEPISPRCYVEEYLVRRRLLHAKVLCLSGNKAWAWDLVKKTRCTSMFKKRRLVLMVMLLFPTVLSVSAVRTSRVLRGLMR